MSRRLLVTGGNGFVAGSLIAQGLTQWEIHSLSRGEAPTKEAGLIWHRIDVTDSDALCRAFEDIKPESVIHAAAIADIDYSEAHRDVARKVNVEVTEVLVNICRKAGVKLVFTSTDTVFDGEKGGYVESDIPVPVNYYGHTKVEAEQIVSTLSGTWVIARLALVMGLPVMGTGNSFLAKMIRTLGEGRPYGVPAEEVRTPVDVITLGRALLELAGSETAEGFVHLAGNDVMNRLEMAQRIAVRLGYRKELVFASDVSKIPNRAPRPRDVSLDNRKARAILKTPMQGLEDGLDLVVSMDQRRAR